MVYDSLLLQADELNSAFDMLYRYFDVSCLSCEDFWCMHDQLIARIRGYLIQ